MMNRIERLSGRERSLLWATLIAVIGASIYVYALEPFLLEWTALRTEANELAAEQAKIESLFANRTEIERRFNEIRGAVTEVAPHEDAMLTLWEQVDTAASRNGLNTTAIKPLGLEKERGFDRVAVRLGAQCEGYQFVGFLQALQRNDHILRCENFTVSVGRTRLPLTISMTLSKLMSDNGGAP